MVISSRQRVSFWATPLIFLVLLGAAAATVSAQCRTALSPEFASGTAGETDFFVTFANSTDWNGKDRAALEKAKLTINWSVFSPTLLQKAKRAANTEKAALYEAAAPDLAAITTDGARALRLTLATPFRPGEVYLVNVAEGNTLIPAACVGSPLSIRLIQPTADAPIPDASSAAAPPVKAKKIILTQVKERKEAEIYVEGIAEGAKGAKTGFTVDASFKRAFRFYRDEPDYFWQPFFNIKASTNAQADPDALNFGVNFETPTGLVPDNATGIKRLYFSEAAKFEADKDFQNINFVGDFRLKLDSTRLANKYFNVIPFVGLEIGRNLKSPVEEAENKLLARPLIGADFISTFYTRKAENGYQKTASFEIFYERRFLLKKEIALDADASGSFVGIALSRAPRDYVKGALTYDFAKNFGFKFNYEYGSLPPLFKLVDNKFSVGLVFKGKFQRK